MPIGYFRPLTLAGAAMVLAGCTDPEPRVALTAEVLKGASPAASPSGAAIRSAVSGATAAPGLWAISPDEARISIVSIGFIQPDGGGDADNSLDGRCIAHYKRSDPTLTRLLDCPFSIHSGSYVGIEVAFKNEFEVLIDDPVNNIYTDPASPTKLSATRPAGGPQMVTYSLARETSEGPFSQRAFFDRPLEIDSGATMPSVSLVADMIHTVFIDVSSSSMAFHTTIGWPAVQLIPSLNGAGRVEYYTSSGTALNAPMGPPGSTNADVNSVRVFYAQPPQPSYIVSPVVGPSSAQNANPATSPESGDLGFRAGGYAGLDASGALCWALPTSFRYDSYQHVRRMQSVSTLGAATVLHTQNLNGGQAPVPVSGDTYASGCPTLGQTDQVTVFLVAK